MPSFNTCVNSKYTYMIISGFKNRLDFSYLFFKKMELMYSYSKNTFTMYINIFLKQKIL